MILSIITLKFKLFFLFFINLFRRALCCFRKRRRLSTDIEPLTHVVSNENPKANDLDQWNNWEFTHQKPSNVQEHIEYYRQQHAKLIKQNSQEDYIEETKDLFEDMAPQITKQKKLLIDNVKSGPKEFSLNAEPGASDFIRSELENWEETGWEGQTLDWDAQELLRENKRQERERRVWEQQQKRIERSNRPNNLGEKIST